MTPTMLIAYATRHGSTRQVADAIAVTLGELGLDVDIRPADDVTDIARYDGVVLGTAIYMGRTHVAARRFLRRHRRPLEARPFFVFGMGPLHTSDREVDGSWRQLEHALGRFSDVTPADVAVFGGVVDPDKLHFPFNRMEASDARDWAVIDAWAREVGAAMTARLHEAA